MYVRTSLLQCNKKFPWRPTSFLISRCPLYSFFIFHTKVSDDKNHTHTTPPSAHKYFLHTTNRYLESEYKKINQNFAYATCVSDAKLHNGRVPKIAKSLFFKNVKAVRCERWEEV